MPVALLYRLSTRSLIMPLMLAVCGQIWAAVPEDFSFPVNSFEFEGELPIRQVLVDEVLSAYTGENKSLEDLQAAAKALESTIRSKGYAFYRVVLPHQPLGSGVIKLQIVPFTLGHVTIKGNQYFDEANIRHSLPSLKEGISPNTEVLAHELKVAIRHPLKDYRVTFKQGASAQEVDAVLDVSDAKPTNWALILANTGDDDTGDFRLTGSFQHTNLWNKDHILNVSYTTSPGHWSDVEQYGGSYALPVYSTRSWFTAYYVSSDVDTGTVATGTGALDVSGAGTMVGLHYLQNLNRVGKYEHWFDLGLDNRLFENDITFLGTPIGVDVRSFPISLRYLAEYPWHAIKFNGYVQYSTNTGYGSDNKDILYAANRFNARKDWQHWRYGLSAVGSHKGWVFTGNFHGQYTNEPLISGEQFGLGGSTSIRGYEEREISKDKGYSINLEAKSPKYKQAHFVGFIDYGHGSQTDVQPGDPSTSHTLASAGVGVRWQYETRILASIDVAHAFRDGFETDAGDNKIHGTLVVNF